MKMAVWLTSLNILLAVVLAAAAVYLFVLVVRALKRYIATKEVRDESRRPSGRWARR